jgi:hypothetical protein
MMTDAPAATAAKEIVAFPAEAHPQGLLDASGESVWLPLHYAVSRSKRPSRQCVFLPKQPVGHGDALQDRPSAPARGRIGGSREDGAGARRDRVPCPRGAAVRPVIYLLAKMSPQALRVAPSLIN